MKKKINEKNNMFDFPAKYSIKRQMLFKFSSWVDINNLDFFSVLTKHVFIIII
jgi:hypothetical protein